PPRHRERPRALGLPVDSVAWPAVARRGLHPGHGVRAVVTLRRTPQLACLLAAAAVVADACGCASGPVFRSQKALAAANHDLPVQVTGTDNRYSDGGLVVVGSLSAPADVAVRGASLANPDLSPPCEAPRHKASALALDGAMSWQRPLPAAGAHAVMLDFPGS